MGQFQKACLYCAHVEQKKSRTIMKHLIIMTIITASVVLASCNVTRTVTTTSEYVQRGDTTVIIPSKTIESYDGIKK